MKEQPKGRSVRSGQLANSKASQKNLICPLFILGLVLSFSACRQNSPPAPVTVSVKTISPELDLLIEHRISTAKSHIDSNQLELALEAYNQAVKMAEDSLGGIHPKTAYLYHSIGNLFNNDFQDREQAIPYFAKAAASRKQLLGQIPDIDIELGKSYFALARVQRMQGMYHQSLESIHDCMQVRENGQPLDSMRLGSAYFEAGIIYRNTGDLNNALRYLNQASNFSTGSTSLANAWNEMGSAYDQMQQLEKAKDFYQKAYDKFEEAEDYWRKNGCLINLGGTYLKSKEYEKALAIFLQADELTNMLLEVDPDDIDTKLAQGTIVNNLGVLYKHLHRYDEALTASQKGLSIALENSGTPYHPEVASSYDNLGNTYAALEKPEESLSAYQAGIQAVIPTFKFNDLLENPVISDQPISEKPILITLLTDKAEALNQFAPEQPDELVWKKNALQTYQTLDTLLVLTRQSCREDGSKYFLAGEAGPIYEKAMSLAFELFEKTNDPKYKSAVWAFCERNKAGVLLESMADAQAKLSVGVVDGIIEEEQTLRKDIAKHELLIYQATRKDENCDSLKQSLFSLKQKMQSLAREIEIASPDYFDQKFALTSTPSVEDLQAKLSDNQALVAYFLGEINLYTVTISKAGYHLHQSPRTEGFMQSVRAYRQAISDWEFAVGQPQEAEKAYLSAASDLYDFLLKNPLEEVGPAIGSLIIVPDGVLGYLPFEALLTKPANSWKSPQTPYLLREYSVSYAYAAQFLLNKKEVNQHTKYDFAGFGLEYDAYTLDAAASPATELPTSTRSLNGLRGELGKLPNSAKEVANITELIGGKYWLNSEATKANFLKYAPESRIIHFAGHGFTDVKEPLNSSLLFTKTNDTTACFLRAADLYGLSFKAQLAVLSACNTGYGELQKGEGIMSFARAFANAGVPSLVMSLWSITDASTANIMQHFYREMEAGKPKSEALRQAKLSYLSETSPEKAIPIYWAGSVLMGDDGALENSSPSWWVFLLGASVIAGGFTFWRKKNQQLS